MNPTIIERMVASKVAPTSTGTPALAAYQALPKPILSDLSVVERSRGTVVFRQRQSHRRPVIFLVGRSAWEHTEHSDLTGPFYLSDLIAGSFEATGMTGQRFLDLAGESASRPQPDSPFTSRAHTQELPQAEDATHAALQQSKRTHVINALAQLEIEDIDASSPFPLKAFSSLSPAEGAELKRILDAGPPPWVRAIIERKAQRG